MNKNHRKNRLIMSLQNCTWPRRKIAASESNGNVPDWNRNPALSHEQLADKSPCNRAWPLQQVPGFFVEYATRAGNGLDRLSYVSPAYICGNKNGPPTGSCGKDKGGDMRLWELVRCSKSLLSHWTKLRKIGHTSRIRKWSRHLKKFSPLWHGYTGCFISTGSF